MVTKLLKNYLLVLKVTIFTFIILSPMINFRTVQFLNNVVIKIAILGIVVGICFIDFQLALLTTIAFLILIINLNNNILNMASQTKHIDNFYNYSKQQPASPLDQQFANSITIPKEIDQTQNIVCQNSQKTNINEDLISHYIDDKIKPYEVFISMMTNEEVLEKAQGSTI